MHPIEPILNFQGSTLLSVLAFLGTAAMLWALGVSFVILLARGNGFAARRVAAAGAGVAGAYLAVLVGFSLVSRGWQVEPGNAWSSRESGCHPAYSVADASAPLPESSLAGNAAVGR